MFLLWLFCKKEFTDPKEHMWELKKEIKFCNKISMKGNISVEFNREKYNLKYKPHAYKIKTST